MKQFQGMVAKTADSWFLLRTQMREVLNSFNLLASSIWIYKGMNTWWFPRIGLLEVSHSKI